MADLAIITKKKSNTQQQMPKLKAKKECFNYGKKRFYSKDCYSNSKRKSKDKKAAKEAKQAC